MSRNELPQTEIEVIDPNFGVDAVWFIETDQSHPRKGCLIYYCTSSDASPHFNYFWCVEFNAWMHYGSNYLSTSWDQVTDWVKTYEGRQILKMLYPYVQQANFGGDGDDW